MAGSVTLSMGRHPGRSGERCRRSSCHAIHLRRRCCRQECLTILSDM